MAPNFGWRKDPHDDRDFTKPKMRLEALPDAVNLVQHTPNVRKQLESGCVGHDIGALLCIEAAIDKAFTEWFSPTWIYNWARAIEGTLASDDGCYPRDAFEGILKNGCLLLKFWPYKGFEKTYPPSSLVPEAKKYPLIKYFRADEGNLGVMSALSLKHPVSLGIPWPEEWMVTKDGILLMVNSSARIVGGHAIVCYGYDRKAGVYLCMNSWGTDSWSYSGKKVPKGHFTFPMEFLSLAKTWGGYDAHFAEVQWGTVSPPVPPEPLPEVWLLRHQVSTDSGQTWRIAASV